MTHLTVTIEQWNQLLALFVFLSIMAGVAYVALTVDLLLWVDRIRWHRRRRARLARRRVRAVASA